MHICNSKARTAAGVPKFDLVKQRHGVKYFAKIVKTEKEHSWRDKIVVLIVQVTITTQL